MGLNTFLVNPSSQELEQSLRSFEASNDVGLHPVVRQSLGRIEQGVFRVPFLSSHGSYLFGNFFVPTSADDGKPELAKIGIIANNDVSLFLVGSDANHSQISDSFTLKLRQSISAADSSVGSIMGVIELVLNELDSHISIVDDSLVVASEGIQRSEKLTSKRADREMASSLARIRIASGELVNLEPIADEMGSICKAISEDLLDVRKNGKNEMFGTHSEIGSHHLAVRSRQLMAATRGASRTLAEIQIAFQAQMSELRIRGNRLLTALASLFLTPVILLNFYSQFLAEGQNLSNEFTANYFWVVIVGLVSLEAAFFRAKKWLR